MGLLNSKKSGFFANVQPSVAPSGNIVPTTATAPQQLIMANASVTLENSPIETTQTLGLALSQPAFPGLISGTVAGLSQATTGYSRCLMINGHPAITNSAKKLLNQGNTAMAPMVQATQTKSYVYVADSSGGAATGTRSGPPMTPEQIKAFMAKNPPWSATKQAAFDASFKRCGNTPPTAAPKSLLGTCQYYQWRNQDFSKRHQNCDHLSPPNYYLDYGYKYCERFSTILYPRLDQAGKVWLTKTRYNLQIALEQLLVQQPDIELNNNAFKDAVFKTHPQAYMDAGFANLSLDDWWYVFNTPDKSTWENPDALEQIPIISADLLEYYVSRMEIEVEARLNQPPDYPKLKDTLEYLLYTLEYESL